MTELLNKNNKADFLSLCGAGDIMACRIACLYGSYFDYGGLIDLWVHYNNGTAAAALARYAGNLSIYCTGEQDNDELTELAAALGCSFAECSAWLPGLESSGVIMKLAAALPEMQSSISVQSGMPPLKEAHRLISSCEAGSFRAPSYEDFLLETSHRLRHGTAKCSYVMDEGKMVAYAMTAALSCSSALIGSVCTEKAYRRRGLASACISGLIKQLSGRSIFIIRAAEENESFYSRLGFENSGGYYTNM